MPPVSLQQLASTSEAARAHATDLMLVGELLAAGLRRAGTCNQVEDLARVWTAHIARLSLRLCQTAL